MTDSGMADLISRAWVLAEYDRQHQGPPGGARKIMAEAPTIDAIPVEWLRRFQSAMPNTANVMGVDVVLKMWQKEQEAQNG